MIQTLLDRSDAARILTFDYIYDLLRKLQLFLGNDLFIFDDIYSDVVINKTKNIQIQILDRAFYFDDIFLAHFLAAGILDNCNSTIQFIQFQVMIDGHSLAGLDMIQNITLTKSTYV